MVRFGICLPHYGKAMEPAGMKLFAEEAESLGFDSIWVTDHVIVPRERNMLYKERMLDPLSTLTYLAAVTSRMRIGTSVIVLPYRHPAFVAKAVATADLLSGGRVIFGAGVGALEGEFHALGANFAERGAVADEYLRAVRALWTDPDADFKGKYATVQGMRFSPLPAQTPHPPVWIGGSTKRAGRRAVELGDGWHATNVTPEQFSDIAAHMRHLSTMRGRATPPMLSVRMPVYFDREPEPGRMAWWGDDAAVAGQALPFIERGAEHLVFGFPDVSFDDAMSQLRRLADRVCSRLR